MALKRDSELRTGDGLASSSAFGDAGDRVVTSCLAFGDQPLDHQHGNEQREGKQRDYYCLGGSGKLHAPAGCVLNVA